MGPFISLRSIINKIANDRIFVVNDGPRATLVC